jgi:hypothetical protein
MRESGIASTAAKDAPSLGSGRAASPISSALEEEGLSFGEGGNQAFLGQLGLMSVPPPSDPTNSQAATAPGRDHANEIASLAFLLDDDAEVVAPHQMKRSDFLSALRPALVAAVDEGLAGTGRTSENCPHMEYWFARLAGKDAPFIERSLRRYAPAARGAQSASDYIPAVASQVVRGTREWVRTGEVRGVPAGLAEKVASRGGTSPHPDDPAAVRESLGIGRSLDADVRRRMESVYGESFGNVRIHTDASSAGLAERFNARAFTVGEHVAFGLDEYHPGTIAGDVLIAHELAHVVQQSAASDIAAPTRWNDSTSGRLEQDADRAAIGSVASLWGATTTRLTETARLASGRLNSGLALQRCSSVTPKLTFEPAGDLRRSVCGAFEWPIRWILKNSGLQTRGIIVQRVDLVREVQDCAGNAVPYNTGRGLNPDWYPVWEAWDVNGTKITPIENGVHDRFGQTHLGDNTRGRTIIRGTAEYYDNATRPNSFTPTGQPPTNNLPATRSDPRIAGGTGAIDHSATATWDCCGADKETQVTTSPPP